MKKRGRLTNAVNGSSAECLLQRASLVEWYGSYLPRDLFTAATQCFVSEFIPIYTSQKAIAAMHTISAFG